MPESKTFPVESGWLIQRAGAPNYAIEITSSSTSGTGETFIAKYSTVPDPSGRYNTTSDPSKFQGELAIREGHAISIRQQNSASGYIAFQSGLRHVGTDTYIGMWYSNAGESGNFSLSRVY